MTWVITFGILAALFAGWRMWRRLRYSLHLSQLHGYKVVEYVRWLIRHPVNYVFRLSHGLGAALILVSYSLADMVPERTLTATMFALWCVFFASSRRYRSDREKKPLVWTPRAKRLFGLSVAMTAVPVLAAAVATVVSAAQELDGSVVSRTQLNLRIWLMADLFAPLMVAWAGILIEPLEAFFRAGFKRHARRALRSHEDLTVVGITGSYGKTSVKFIISEILSQRLQVLAPPGSYNTPMGLCKVINNNLRSHHQVFVAEMGLRHPGDIAELCDLVRPDVGVITNVGVAHLESMGSVEAIAREKGVLAERVPAGGTVVLNADDERVLAMKDATEASVITVSAAGNPADVTAHNIRYDAEGATFTVRLRDGSEQVFTTQLLGKHNVVNILMGIAVGRSEGLRLRQMTHAVKRIKPVDHRLHLRREGDILIIDDAFNSNPVGARNAVEILGQFRTGRRVIVTPGMVELGTREEDENRAFGEAIAEHADLAVLVGPERTRPIAAGLRDAGFPEERIHVLSSLFEAQDFLRGYLSAGDVVLYENDLPDQYDEAS
jgi:UDP-N-acetylmuramoyl-tripeptide--D-alanyl-D-alanine ligase